MSRGRRTFRQRDVQRAVRAVEAAGRQVSAVEIASDGQIRLVLGTPGPQDLCTADDELEQWRKGRARQCVSS
jgi:hypothetical protein